MASKIFTDFPEELRAPVLRLLSFRDLVSLSFVNKDAQALAEPLLYADISLTWAWDHLPALAPLLRTLLERPDLAQHVHRLHLDGTEYTEKFSKKDIEPPALPVSCLPMTKAYAKIQSTGVPLSGRWADELKAGAADALVALLVSMLPNLKCLHLGPNFTVENHCLGHMLRCALKQDSDRNGINLPGFTSLSHVTLSRRTNEWRHKKVNNATDVLPFLLLPNIKSLSISIDNPKDSSWSVPQANNSITSLELFRLRESRLELLLSPLRSLKTLHWHWYYQESIDSHASGPVIELTTMVTALSNVAETLTNLTIEAETNPDVLGGDYEPPAVEPRGSLRGLSKLQKLETLHLPWLFLMGPSPQSTTETAGALGELLPPNIEVLTITSELLDYEQFEWEDEVFMRGIRAALQNQKAMASLPKLKRIILPVPCYGGGTTEEIQAELQELSDLSGIKLQSEDDK
jgi:hypothetical protein